MGDWNSGQYLKFQNERTQPAVDLANRININNPKKIIDIGSGPGNSTAVLKNKFPNAYIVGIDNSDDMIAKAKKEYPELDFIKCDANSELSKLGNDFDIVFSNACIQWLPNHNTLLKNMMGLLKCGGILAVQTPMNYEEPIHKIIGEVSSNEKWKAHFNNPRIFYNLTESEYFDLLSEMSPDFSIWKTTYFHDLKSHKDIMEWYKATGLRPYFDMLRDEKDKKEFETDIYLEVKKQYPMQKNHHIIFRFPRFFFTATK